MKSYKIVLTSWGGIEHDYMSELTYEEALETCEMNNWECSPEDGYVWDMEIQEM